VNCGQTTCCTEMPLGMRVGPGQGNIVTDGGQSSKLGALSSAFVLICRVETTRDIPVIMMSLCMACQDVSIFLKLSHDKYLKQFLYTHTYIAMYK